MFKHRRVAIDFDGTLFEDIGSIDKSFERKVELTPIKGANETTHWLKKNEFEILIFTCRPDYHRQYLEGQLKKNNISFDYILFYTKPRVDLYIDDKGFRFESWQHTQEWISEKLGDNEVHKKTQQPNTIFEKALRKSKVKPLLKHNISSVLDIGGGDGDVWHGLSNLPFSLDLVEPDNYLREKAREKKVYANIFNEIKKIDLTDYDCTTVLGVLEHINDEYQFLEELKKSSRLYFTVPNANSFHRYLGMNLGVINTLEELQSHDHEIGHVRYYTYETFHELIRNYSEKHGYRIIEYGTTSFKLSTNKEMELFYNRYNEINETAENLGFIGENKKYGAEIYALLELRK